MDKVEGKKRMTASLWQYVSREEVLEALLDVDSTQLDKIKALKGRLDDINAQMVIDVDAADGVAFDNIVNTFTHPVDSVK